MNKKFLEKIISFGMGYCVKNYKNNNKQDRTQTRVIIKDGASFITIDRHFNGRENAIDLNNLNVVFFYVFSIVFIVCLYTLGLELRPFNEISKVACVLITLVLPIVAANSFRKSQCKYLLNEFRKIDEIDAIDAEKREIFKRKIAACNLFLK